MTVTFKITDFRCSLRPISNSDTSFCLNRFQSSSNIGFDFSRKKSLPSGNKYSEIGPSVNNSFLFIVSVLFLCVCHKTSSIES